MQPTSDVISALRRRGETVCTVESLTGGLLCAGLTEVPGASAVVLGGIVAYTMDVKHDVVGVDRQVLSRYGAVSEEAAEALARRAREIFGASWALATTGVAGPATQEGKPVGTVFVAVDGPRPQQLGLTLTGDRHGIRRAACEQALGLFHRLLE